MTEESYLLNVDVHLDPDQEKIGHLYDDLKNSGTITEELMVVGTSEGRFQVLGHSPEEARLQLMASVMLASIGNEIPSAVRVRSKPPSTDDPTQDHRPETTGLLNKQPGRSLAMEWATVEQGLLFNAPSNVRKVMRDMFYTGGLMVMNLISDSLEKGDQMTDHDLARMDALSDELERFAAENTKGGGGVSGS